MRRMAYASVARGADGVMFFRWRPAHFGAEIYWMGIIDHDDIPRRRYDEAKQFAGEVTALKDKILGTHVRMDLGIAGSDFDNQEMHRSYPIGMPSPQDDATLLHRYCYRHNIACGFIHPEDDLSKLRVERGCDFVADQVNKPVPPPFSGRIIGRLVGIQPRERLLDHGRSPRT